MLFVIVKGVEETGCNDESNIVVKSTVMLFVYMTLPYDNMLTVIVPLPDERGIKAACVPLCSVIIKLEEQAHSYVNNSG